MKLGWVTQLLIVSLITLIILFVQVGAFKNFSAILYSDNAIYATIAEKFHEGDFNNAVHIWWQPFFPLVASAVMLSGFTAADSLFYISLLSGVLVFIPVFYLTKSITGNIYYSVFAGLLASFNDKLINSYFQLLTENLYVLLFTSAILFSFLYLSRRKKVFLIFGALFYGLGYLTRSDILLAVQIFVLSVILLYLGKRISFKVFLISLITFGAVFTAVISPYLYYNYQKFGFLNLSAKLNASLQMPAYFAPQNNFTTTYAQEVWSLDTVNYDSRYFNQKYDIWKNKRTLFDDAVTRTKVYLKLLWEKNSGIEVSAFLLGYLLSIYYFFRFNKAGLFLNAIIPLNFLLATPFQPVADFRYLFWAYPLAIVFIALALFLASKIITSLARSYRFNRAGLFILVIINLVTLLGFYSLYKGSITIPSHLDRNKNTSDPYQIVGEHIKETEKTGARIMYRREGLVYYADGMIIYIPTNIGENELKSYALLWKTEYLVADKFTFAPETPLGYLVDETKAPDWLKPVKTWDKEMTKTVLYKFQL